MKTHNVKVVRIYTTESTKLLTKIVNYLKEDAKIKGVTVFRAIEGVGESGLRTAAIVDLSLNLPLAIEFFDTVERVDQALAQLKTMTKPEHVITWMAETLV